MPGEVQLELTLCEPLRERHQAHGFARHLRRGRDCYAGDEKYTRYQSDSAGGDSDAAGAVPRARFGLLRWKTCASAVSMRMT